MKYNPKKNLTTYMVAHKSNDTTVIALRKLLDLSLCAHNPSLATHALLDDPLEIHVMVATLSFEASKHHVKRFQRFMWEQVEAPPPPREIPETDGDAHDSSTKSTTTSRARR